MLDMDTVLLRELPEPNPGGQAAFMNDYTHRFCAYIGGLGSGKSWAGARKLANLHVINAFDIITGQPTFCRGLMISITYGIARVVNMPQMETAFDEMGLKWKFIADPKRYCYEFPDLGMYGRPSEILVRSADTPELIAGFEVGHIWGDECARWYMNMEKPLADAFLQSEARLRDARANMLQFNVTGTHEGEYTRLYWRFEATERPNHKLYRGNTRDNKHNADTYVQTLLENLSPELVKQYVDGFAALFKGGIIYGGFTDADNLDNTLELDYSRPLQFSIDFNINPGCHAIIGQYNRERDLAVALYELHEDRLDVQSCIKRVFPQWLRDICGAYHFPGKLELFGDATGGNANAATSETCWDVLQEGLRAIGVPFSAANVPTSNPHVADRVLAVNSAFKNAIGKVRYKVHPRCERLIRDFKMMKWKGNELDKDDKKLSHASDADGYRIYQLMPIGVRLNLSVGHLPTAR